MVEAFKKKYPFIDAQAVEIEGAVAYQRFLLELKAGTSNKWDSTYLPYDNYNAFLPYQMKFDILGMASAGILNIHPRMVDPVNRNTVSANTVASVAVYNRKLIAEEKVPSKWEDFLKPEFKGRKFAADIRPSSVAALVPVWGLEATLDFARRACGAGTGVGHRRYEGDYGASVGRGRLGSRCPVKQHQEGSSKGSRKRRSLQARGTHSYPGDFENRWSFADG